MSDAVVTLPTFLSIGWIGLKEGNTGVHQGWNTTTQTEAVVSPTRPVLSNPNIQAIYVRTPTATQQTLNRARPCLVTNSSQMMCSSPSSGTTNHVQLPSPHLIQSSPAKLSSPPTLHAGTQVNNNNSICHATSPLRMSGSPKKECRSPETQVPSQYPPMSTPVASHSVDCQTTSDKDVVLVGSSQQTMFRYPPSIQQKLVGIGQIPKQSLDLSDVIGNPAGQPLTAPTSLKVVGQNKELVKNTVYLLKSPRNAGNAMMAKWDGKQFIPYQASQVDMTGQLHQKIEGHMPNILKTGLAGGGGGLTRKVRQSRPLGGYSTGLQELRTEKSPTKPPDQQDVPQNVLPNGRLWHHTVKPLTRPVKRSIVLKKLKDPYIDKTTNSKNHPSFCRRPLHPDENSYRDGEKGTDNTEMQVTQQEDGPKVNKAMTHAPLHPNDRIPNVSSADGELPEPDSRAEVKDKIQNVCSYCGFTVFSNERCERCHRLLSYTKKGSTNKRLRTEEPCDRVNNSTIDKRSFYGRKLHEHTNILEGCSKIIVLNSNTQGVSLVAQGSHPPVDGNKATKPKRSAPRVRKRKPIIVTEPVTISSDEEEPQTPNPVNSEVPSLNIPTTVDEVSQDSNSSAKYSDGSKNNCPDEPDDTLPHAPSPKFFKGSLTKRSEMEPELSSLEKYFLDQAAKNYEKTMGKRLQILEEKTEDGTKCQESEKISSDIPDFVQEIIDDENKVRCEIRSFRVGSFRGEPIGLLLVSTKGINCEVEAWSGEVCHIAIKPNEIERVMYCVCNKLTVFFFQTSFECGVRLRKYLLLKPNTDIYFDPCSEQRHFQFIIVIMDYKDFPELERNGVTEILNYYKLQHHPTKSDYLKVISYEMANSVLVSCTPNVDQILNASLRRNTGLPSPSAPSTPFTQHEFNRDSPSPPKIGFVGPIERLIIYPPPPAARGVPVSNEDLYCLNEGEFLNDVIIDFYLKYFYLEKLNDEDRKRTHIFSSFFYKRLTQRERKNLVSDENEDEEDTTPIEKRHSRVRTWTRQVDLFEKDFIIVPINEHSHWFLAIICFPGKLKEEHVMYLPRSKLIPQNTEDTTEKTADSETDTSTGTPKDLAASDQSESNNIQLPNPEQSDSENLPNPEQSDSETQSVQQSASLEPSSSTLTHSVLSINSELSSPEHIGNQRLNSLQVSEMSDKSEEPMETDIQPKEEEQQSVSQSNCDNSEVQDTNHSNDLDVSSQNSVEKTQFDQCAQNNPTVPFPGNEGTVMNPEVQFPCNEGTVRNQEQSTPSAEETKNENATQQNSTQCTPKKPVLREGKEVIGRELTEEEIESEFKKKSWMTGTRRPCILVFDSLVGPSRSNVIRILRERVRGLTQRQESACLSIHLAWTEFCLKLFSYLQVEWKVKKKTDRQFDRDTIKGANPKVPQQDNYSDCGIYVLQYVESFFKEPIMDYSIPMRIPNWFDLNTVGRKRQDIIDLINSLHAEQSKQNKPRR